MSRILLILFFFFLPVAAIAEDAENLYAYETAKGMKIGAVFGKLPELAEDDRLISATSPVCDHVEIHTMTEANGGIWKMRKADGMPVLFGKENTLDPTGYHLMLMGLKDTLENGQHFILKVMFEKAGERIVTIPVKSRK